jgi:hypothetical protein
MTGVSDQYTTIGHEAVAWGTRAATLTRLIEAEPQKATHNVEFRPTRGMRAGFIGKAADRQRVDNRGGTYVLDFDLLTKSHSLALATVGLAPVIATPGGGTLSKTHTIAPTDRLLRSTTIHDYVVHADGTEDHVDYLGGKATQLDISVSPKGNVQTKITFNFKECDTSAASVTPAAASEALPYVDQDVTTTLDGDAICQQQIDISIPTMANIDKNMVCPAGRDEPFAQGWLIPTGTLSFDTQNLDYLDAYLAGTQMPLVFTIDTGVEIETGKTFQTVISFPNVQFTGDGYDRKIQELTNQPLPWEAVEVAGEGLWSIVYQTTDTAA